MSSEEEDDGEWRNSYSELKEILQEILDSEGDEDDSSHSLDPLYSLDPSLRLLTAARNGDLTQVNLMLPHFLLLLLHLN